MMMKYKVDEFKEKILKGQELPTDLKAIIENECIADLLIRKVNFELISDSKIDKILDSMQRAWDDNPDDIDFRAHITAMRYMYEKITFFAEGFNGALLGYWHDEGSLDILKAPIVKMDREEIFQVLYDAHIIESVISDFINEDEDEWEVYKTLFLECGVVLPEIWDIDVPKYKTEPETLKIDIYNDYRVKHGLKSTQE